MVYSIGSTIAQYFFELYKLLTKQNCSSSSANIKTATDRKEKCPVIQLKVHASIFDIIKNNSRQRNTLKGLFSLEIDVIKVPEGKPDVFQAPTS